ncbi:hypothetical protein N657DRAFT_640351 [Parathielavia appendiculata]|uniref:Uncharacterized protein n=1 Tax=Parathielavia appendiculata TaxID=2587402 RepID=A0AAN6Z960_9PEZI|nr:hypothetical protein N657DRAFT_640351 [Parathielavia appendiculata]
MEGAVPQAQWKVCRDCNVEQPIDQFLDRRGNGRIVRKCLDCRDKQRASVTIQLFPFYRSSSPS